MTIEIDDVTDIRIEMPKVINGCTAENERCRDCDGTQCKVLSKGKVHFVRHIDFDMDFVDIEFEPKSYGTSFGIDIDGEITKLETSK